MSALAERRREGRRPLQVAALGFDLLVRPIPKHVDPTAELIAVGTLWSGYRIRHLGKSAWIDAHADSYMPLLCTQARKGVEGHRRNLASASCITVHDIFPLWSTTVHDRYQAIRRSVPYAHLGRLRRASVPAVEGQYRTRRPLRAARRD